MMETPRSELFDDIYFQPENGLNESRFVFLEQNHLPEDWEGKADYTIVETGFGTGLNFLCAWTLFERTAFESQKLTYVSFEKYPLSKDNIAKYLGHWSGEFGGKLQKLIDLYPLRIGGWHKIHVSENVTLLLIFDDVNRALPQFDYPVDCWFLDGHAPDKNPDMWSDTVFSAMARLSVGGARMATFTSAGFVRRGLESVGFQVEKVKGFGRKREMIVGVFMRIGRVKKARPVLSRAAIIGGGIAGSAMVHALQSRDVEVNLFEKNGLASGGSGNVCGLFNPRFTALQCDDSDFYSAAFSNSLRLFQSLNHSHDIGFVPCGSLHFMGDDKRRKRLERFVQNCDWHGDHVRQLSCDEAQEISGVRVQDDALFLPDAGSISPYKTVISLSSSAQIINEEVGQVVQNGNDWIVNGRSYDAVILACAADVTKFEQVSWLPVHTVRGQVSVIAQPDYFSGLKTNLCYGGYASHPFDGSMVVGSTFQPWSQDLSVRDDDHAEVLQMLKNVVDGFDGRADIIGARAGFRCAAKDRVPIVGDVPNIAGLYLTVAHGSYGLTTSPLSAEIIAADLCGEVSPVPKNVRDLLSVKRFIDRAKK